MSWNVIHGDCLQAMAAMPENSVDAVVCDPPYDLTAGKKGGTGVASLNLNSPAGRSRISTGGGFMGKEWDATGIAFNVATWQAVYRVLKPGGYLIAFGGSRTYHRMVVAIEDAGFVIHPMIGWCYATGFPKATNLSKRFDAEAGAEREIVGVDYEFLRRNPHKAPDSLTYNDTYRDGVDAASITAPATDLARAWDGWFYGRQSLKPSLEPCAMAQKPPQGRMTDNVRQWSTGAINVDACRVGTTRGVPASHSKTPNKIYGVLPPEGRNPDELNPNVGRWPPNLVFSHHPACVPLGERRVKGSSGTVGALGARSGGIMGKVGTRKDAGQPCGYADADGYETVTAWQCVEGCPVALLDAQSENASRFFPTFSVEPEYDAPWLFQAKASRRERNAGLEGLPEHKRPGLFDDDSYEWKQPNGHVVATPQANHHPTVKPVALLRWLCRLVTPPGGLVLDCFAGSGSTGMAALLEGFSFVGIEQDPEYAEIARRRIAHVERHGERWLTAKATPNPAPAALPEPSQPTTMQQTMFPLEEAS